MRYSFHRVFIWYLDGDGEVEDVDEGEVEECEMVAVANAWARALISYRVVGYSFIS